MALAGCDEPQDMSLRIGMMPAVDSVPLVVAQAEEFFEEQGIEVELVLFRDQLQREAALQTGEIDLAISDLVNAISALESESGYQVVLGTDGYFSLLSSPLSPITSLDEWPALSVATGLVETSIVYYLADRMLQAEGLDPETIEVVPTLQIPVRMELLLESQLEAAVLPEPLSRVAVLRGAHELVSTEVLEETPGVLLATPGAIESKTDALAALVSAWNDAVQAFNANPSQFRPLVAERLGFPGLVVQEAVLPEYRSARPPSLELVNDVSRWMIGRGLVDEIPAYDDLVY